MVDLGGTLCSSRAPFPPRCWLRVCAMGQGGGEGKEGGKGAEHSKISGVAGRQRTDLVRPKDVVDPSLRGTDARDTKGNQHEWRKRLDRHFGDRVGRGGTPSGLKSLGISFFPAGTQSWK